MTTNERIGAIPEYMVHRCRFLKYMPSAINSLSFSPMGTLPYLAVGRSNGDIELWNIFNDWHLERKILGGEGSSVESLVWSSFGVAGESDEDDRRPQLSPINEHQRKIELDPMSKLLPEALDKVHFKKTPLPIGRLFSGGLSGEIIEWDLGLLDAKRRVDSHGGPIWSMSLSKDQSILAVSCEDGAIRLFSLTETSLNYSKSFDRQSARILSLDWHPSGKTLASGDSEGKIRIWDVDHGRTVQHMTVENKLVDKKTFVWSVICLSNEVIVSGDALGNTCFWNGKTGTMEQKFKSHEADVLCLAMTNEENTVYSAGVDFKIVQFKRQERDGSWIQSGHKRSHSHDIRCLVISPYPFLPLLLSGGMDSQVILHHSLDLNKIERERRLSPFPQQTLVSLSKSQQVFLIHFEHYCQLWSLGKARMNVPMVGMNQRQRVDKTHNIACSALSENAEWIAISTRRQLKLFKKNESTGEWNKVEPNLHPVRILLFSPDSKILASITFDHKIQIVTLSELQSLTFLKPEFQHSFYIHSLSFNHDSTLLGISTSTEIQVYELGQARRFRTIPNPHHDSSIHFIQFHISEPIIIISGMDNVFYLYDVENGSLDGWSAKYSKVLPRKWTHWLKEKPLSIAMSPLRKEELLFWGVHFITWFDLTRPLTFTPYCESFSFENEVESHENKKSKDKKDACFLSKAVKKNQRSNLESYEKLTEIEGHLHAKPRLSVSTHNSPSYSTPVDINPTTENIARSGGTSITAAPTVIMSHAYRPLLFCDFLADGSLVVIEKSWMSILKNLPASYQRTRYGS